MAGSDAVFVGIPVWRSPALVPETIASVLRQSHTRLRVLISIDGGDEISEAACRPFLGDARVRLLVQPAHLGWVRNTAYVLAAAQAEGADYACVQPHDDLLESDYLAALLEAARAHPAASVVYSDIEVFGTQTGTVTQPSVTGTPMERMRTLLLEHYAAVAYRGLTPVWALGRVPPISRNSEGDFAADTVWMTRLARVGDLVRVPRLLYRKRLYPESAHGRWMAWPPERKIAAWRRHCLDMLAEALMVSADPAEREDLRQAARTRLLQLGSPTSPYRETILAMPKARIRRLSASFDAEAASLMVGARKPVDPA